MRKVEEKAMVAMVYGKDSKDNEMTGIKVGDFEAKSEKERQTSWSI